MKKKFDDIPKDVQRQCIDKVIARIEEISDSEVGFIAAQDVVDVVTHALGPHIHNLAIQEAKNLLQQRFLDMDVDIDLLKQSV